MKFSYHGEVLNNKAVHVLLVSLLAYQLSGQFLNCFGYVAKKKTSLRDRTIFFVHSLDLKI